MKILYISFSAAIDAYKRIVARGDNDMKCRDEARLIMLLSSDLHDDRLYPNMEDKLAHLICALLKEHLFTDGNKRAAVVLGALMVLVNGYDAMLPRYMQVMRENIDHISTERISINLLRDMLQSVLLGDEDFNEMLKLRLLMAIDDDWAKTEPLIGDGYVPYFEKQYKESKRADNGNSVDGDCLAYPCLKLVFNYDWNDYGYHTWFCLWLVDEDRTVRIGDVKIMHRDDNVYEHLQESFTELGDPFCSVGMDMEYYDTLKKTLGLAKAKSVLHALRDCATDDLVYEQFTGDKIFINSLMRDMSTQKARREARFMLEGRDMSEAYSFEYEFVPIYNKRVSATWGLHFDYESHPYKRTYAVIGENGVGKTQLMASLARDLTSMGAPSLSKMPLLAGVMVICSSAFDAYWQITPENSQIKLTRCSLVQSENTINELHDAINIILGRGTYYVNRTMLQMWEHYENILIEQLGEDVVTEILGKDYIERDGKQTVDKVWQKESGVGRLVERLSTGQLQIFSLITYVCAYIHLNTLFLIDEPEVHLHPRLVTNFFRMLNELLEKFESYAIISTHSPLVIRECVQQNVYVMNRTVDDIPTIAKVPYRTFGEDLTTLYQKVFESDERDSYFYQTIWEKALRPRSSYKKLVSELEAEGIRLTMNSRNLIRECFEEIENAKEV